MPNTGGQRCRESRIIITRTDCWPKDSPEPRSRVPQNCESRWASSVTFAWVQRICEIDTHREQRNHLARLGASTKSAHFQSDPGGGVGSHILLTKRSLLTGFLPFTFAASVLRPANENDQFKSRSEYRQPAEWSTYHISFTFSRTCRAQRVSGLATNASPLRWSRRVDRATDHIGVPVKSFHFAQQLPVVPQSDEDLRVTPDSRLQHTERTARQGEQKVSVSTSGSRGTVRDSTDPWEI